jgi:hypothetical protein
MLHLDWVGQGNEGFINFIQKSFSTLNEPGIHKLYKVLMHVSYTEVTTSASTAAISGYLYRLITPEVTKSYSGEKKEYKTCVHAIQKLRCTTIYRHTKLCLNYLYALLHASQIRTVWSSLAEANIWGLLGFQLTQLTIILWPCKTFIGVSRCLFHM